TIFAVVLAVFRYVSLASVISVGAFPAISWAFSASSMSLMGLGVIAAASIVIIARHEGNIRRLLAHEEPRLVLTRS
ncbi:MAG: glycerol-3-phosphate acyltransferase, partial [Acidobacteriales bacterium]|nr:glycerol-3-phosphate acyltransferase [Terriglobales bacterium]